MADKQVAEHPHSRWIGVYVAILAALLAVCTLGGNNSTKDAMRANIDAANLWSFFQAKNTRRAAYIIAADDLELMLQANPAIPAEAKSAVEAKIKSYRETVTRFSSDPNPKEGLDELFAKAKAIEKDRDIAFRKDPYFDASQALLQIAIVLASVALITQAGLLLWTSFALAALGTLLLLNGYTLLVSIPGLG